MAGPYILAFDRPQIQCLSVATKAHEPNWQYHSIQYHVLPRSLACWLLDLGSLTQKLLQKAQGHFRIDVLQQRVQQPRRSEYQALSLNHRHWAVVREAILYGHNKPWVYARTVIPLSTLKGSLRRLHYLGNRSLGSELFADPSMQRQSLELAVINKPYLPKHDDLQTSTSPVWGRRSLFFLKNKPLLVSEVFLEDLLLT